uniref:SCP domain-containing protein n=1 Tax=Timema cristinae TaxID=61476 RepID=A0A7R9CKS6_TIMCR|nr:unnamed protein product [Timema cristinae]
MDQEQKDIQDKGEDWRRVAEGEVWKDRQEWKRIYQTTRRGYIRDNVETEKSPRYFVAGSSNNCNKPVLYFILHLQEGVATACNTPFSRGFNQTEKNAIVDEHNRLRNIVALGKESRGNPGPQPSAANMRKIVMYFRILGKF